MLAEGYEERRAEARRLGLERYCWEHEEATLVRIYDELDAQG